MTMRRRTVAHLRRLSLAVPAAFVLSACGDDPFQLPGDDDGGDPPRFADCNLDVNLMMVGAVRDGIPSLDDPVWQRADESVPDYLDPDSRVVGIFANGQAFAIPFNLLWHHEIVNFDTGGPAAPKVAVTYCPLTGSSLVFDRGSVDGATLGVSGLLFMNNLLVYDRRDPDDTLWPQMLAEARCGSRTGSTLERFPSVELEWAAWLELHPSTWVLSGAEAQGFNPIQFDYTAFGYPYGSYRETAPFFNQQIMPEPDTRRFAKERVIGVPSITSEDGTDQGIAFPFGALTGLDGDHQLVPFEHEGGQAAVLWSDEAQGGAAFLPVTTDGEAVVLRVTERGIEDEATGSRWGVDGRAIAGPMLYAQLVAVAEAHTAFWGAWAAFHPNTLLWEGG